MPSAASPQTPVADAPDGASGGRLRSRPLPVDARGWGRLSAIVLAVGLVFLVHFRPWQGGLLEEWSIALAWKSEGIDGLFTQMSAMLARPFHLVPYYLGLVLTDGGLVGQYVVLATLAVAQLIVAVWALRALLDDTLLRWTAGLAISLHPWWIAGDTLRFLGNQVAVLCVVIWLGAALRFLQGRSWWWMCLGWGCTALGLLTYQGPAVSLLVGSAVIAMLSRGARRRRVWLVAGTTLVVLAVTAWSVAIAPALEPSSYEAQLGFGAVDVAASAKAIARTLLRQAPEVVAFGFALGLIVVALGFHRVLPAPRAWLLLGGVAIAPASAFVFAATMLHLNDPERVAFPVGVTLWLVMCCVLPSMRDHAVLRSLTVGALVVGVASGTLIGYATWTKFGSAQLSLVAAVQSVRDDAPPDATLIVADNSGRYGDVYLLLPPHLDIALDVTYGDGPQAELCTPDGVQREHPTASVYPISTTPDCSTLLTGADVATTVRVDTVEGPVDIYVVRPAS